MDLGKVKAQLERGAYTRAKEFVHDVNLVWANCMLYHAEDTALFKSAAILKKVFEEQYAKGVHDEDEQDPNQLPTLKDKHMFSQNIHTSSAEKLGEMVQMLKARCTVRRRPPPSPLPLPRAPRPRTTFRVAPSAPVTPPNPLPAPAPL